jgi:hypothetical protein
MKEIESLIDSTVWDMNRKLVNQINLMIQDHKNLVERIVALESQVNFLMKDKDKK